VGPSSWTIRIGIIFAGSCGDACRKHAIQLHAFVLMDNHFHLLLTPSQTGVLPQAMRSVGQNYVQAFNDPHVRCGTLWQSRFKSCLVETC
jgi:putative transposase